MDRDSNSSEPSNISMSSGVEAPEDPVNEPIYLDKKHNKGLYKVILEKGEGYDKPGTIDRVVLALAENHESELPQPQEFILGRNSLPSGLEKGITTMRRNEVAQVFVPGEYAAGSRLTYKLQLLSWMNIHDLHADGNLVKTIQHKGIGFDRVELKDEAKLHMKISDGGHILFEQTDWELIVDLGLVSAGILDILKTMKMHEISSIVVRKDYFMQHFELPEPAADPTVEIEVLYMKKAEDINHDGTFYKRILVSGEGKDLPNTNARVCVHYRMQSQAQSLTSNFECAPLEFIMDDEQVPTLWTNCLKQMKVGDSIKVECNLLGLSTGDLCDGLNAQFNLESYATEGLTNLDVYLELVSFEMGKVSYNMTLGERVEEATRIKSVANVLFRLAQYERALHKYEAANVCLQPLNDDPNEFRPVHMTLMSNIALCYLKLQNYHKTEHYAGLVISHNPDDAKALLRRGTARRELSNYDGALQDLRKAETTGNSVELKMVQQELQVLLRLIAQYRDKEKSLYQKMFKTN